MRKKRAKCQHPPHRLYSWFASANNGEPRSVLCVGCCDCGKILRGAA